jgi:hypothetical protein
VNKKTLFFLIGLIIIFLFWFVKLRPTSTSKIGSNNPKWVDCTSTIYDKPEKYADWSTRLYAAKLEDKSTENGAHGTDTREFELSKLTSKTDTDSIYYRVQRDVFPQNYVTGSKVVLEICNDKNQTMEWYSTKWDKIPESGEKISARVTHMHSTQQVLVPGKYRVDAYFFIDGKWHFSDRIEGVTLK